jgi:hypothetical protein
MTQDDAGLLLEKAAIFLHPCDLDLFLFFVRHPRTLLSSDSLAAFLGYGLKQIADSLELLLGAGLVKRTQTTAHAARLYLLVTDVTDNEWLPSILEMASTRKGRILLKKELALRRRSEMDQSSLIGAPLATESFPLRDRGRSAVRRVRRRGGR